MELLLLDLLPQRGQLLLHFRGSSFVLDRVLNGFSRRLGLRGILLARDSRLQRERCAEYESHRQQRGSDPPPSTNLSHGAPPGLNWNRVWYGHAKIAEHPDGPLCWIESRGSHPIDQESPRFPEL